MSMSSDDIYIGNIRKCTIYVNNSLLTADGTCFDGFGLESELYKENAILYKTKTGRYVDIENIKSIIDSFRIRRDESSQKYGLLMPTIAYGEDTLYVDRESLRPYSNNNLEVSVKKLKQELRRK